MMVEAKKEQPKKRLAEVVAALKKKNPDLRLGSLSAVAEEVSAISTGNLAIDQITGVGGIPLGRSVEFYGAPSCGKGQDLDAPVLTPDRGYVRMGDLRIGDRLVDPEGATDSRLIGIFPLGVRSVYRITFSDGTWAEATGDHLWSVWDYLRPRDPLPTRRDGLCAECQEKVIRARGLCISCYSKRKKSGTLPPRLLARPDEYDVRLPGRFERRVLTTDQIRDRSRLAQRRIQLPVVSRFDFDEPELPLDPYLLGVLLGNGALASGSPRLTIGQQDAEATLAELADLLPVGVSIKPVSGTEIEYGITGDGTLLTRSNPLTAALQHLGVRVHSWEKFVPAIYLQASFATRLAVLQGLMDTDGNYRASGGAEFNSSSRQLRDDVAELARSVGLTVRLLADKTAPYYTKPDGERVVCRPAYRLSLTGECDDLRVFRLARKARPLRTRGEGRRMVRSVTYVGDRECQCIKVSAPSEMYLTRDYIPTHNTTTALQAAASLQAVIKAGGDPARGIAADDVIGYFDFEQALDPNYALSLGLDTGHESFVFMQPNSMEEGGDVMRALIESGQMRLAIVDSVASMNTERALEAATGKDALAMHQARVLSDLLKTLNILLRQNNCSVIWLNQIRHVINMGGGRPGMPPVTTTPGGDALKFYSSLRMEYRQIRQISVEVEDMLTGETVSRPNAARVRVRCTKNKCAPPFAEAEVLTRFGKGFDNFWSAVQVLLAAGLIIAPAGTGYFYFDKGAPEHIDMQHGGSGKKVRPYLRTEERLLRFADTHPEWRAELIELATVTLAARVAGSLVMPVEEVPEEQSVSIPVAAHSLPSLVGPGELDSALTPEEN